MLELLGHYIIGFIESTRYAGIFVLMTLESALIPIPSEITMPFSGFLASSGRLSLQYIILTGTIANLVGSYIAYYIGYFLEETILVGLIKKYGKFVFVSHEDYERAHKWFLKYGDKIIFISRLLPGVRTVISLPAGMFEMDIKKFTIFCKHPQKRLRKNTRHGTQTNTRKRAMDQQRRRLLPQCAPW